MKKRQREEMAEEEQERDCIYEDEGDDCVSLTSEDEMNDDEWAEQDELENEEVNLYNNPLDSINEILEFTNRFGALQEANPDMYAFLMAKLDE